MKKKLIHALIIMFFSLNSQAQDTIISLFDLNVEDTPPIGNVYLKDTNNTFDKFLETWVYNNGSTLFEITFIKKTRVRLNQTRFYSDQIVCEYKLINNGIIIYDTYGANSNVNGITGNFIFGGVINSDNEISLQYSEPPVNSCHKYASGKLTLEYIDGTVPTLNWTRVNDQQYGSFSTCPDGSDMDFTDFQIPANMVLTKQ